MGLSAPGWSALAAGRPLQQPTKGPARRRAPAVEERGNTLRVACPGKRLLRRRVQRGWGLSARLRVAGRRFPPPHSRADAACERGGGARGMCEHGAPRRAPASLGSTPGIPASHAQNVSTGPQQPRELGERACCRCGSSGGGDSANVFAVGGRGAGGSARTTVRRRAASTMHGAGATELRARVLGVCGTFVCACLCVCA